MEIRKKQEDQEKKHWVLCRCMVLIILRAGMIQYNKAEENTQDLDVQSKSGCFYNLMKCYTDTSTAAVPYYP